MIKIIQACCFGLLALGVCGASAAQSPQRNAPAFVAGLIARYPLTLLPDQDNKIDQTTRTVIKGDKLFSLSILAAPKYRLAGPVQVSLDGAPVRIDAQTIFERRVADSWLRTAVGENSLILCVRRNDDIAAAIKQVRPQYNSFCLIGAASLKATQAIFFKSSGNYEQHIIDISPIEIHEDDLINPVSGKISFIFDGFPIQKDQFRLKINIDGDYHRHAFIINSGVGFYYYYDAYCFVKYSPDHLANARVAGIQMEIQSVDRTAAAIKLKTNKIIEKSIFFPIGWGRDDIVPDFISFNNSGSERID